MSLVYSLHKIGIPERGSCPRTHSQLCFQDGWGNKRRKMAYRCEVTQTKPMRFPNPRQILARFPFTVASALARSLPAYERKLMLGRTAAFCPQGPTSILPGWMTSLICCIATSPVSCLFFLSISSVKCLQWDVIRLRKGGLRCHFIFYLLPCLYLQS